MKLARYSDATGERWGSVDVDAATIQAVAGTFEEWAPTVTDDGGASLELVGDPVELDSVTLLPPLITTSEIVGTGINYPGWVLPPEGSESPYYQRPLRSIAAPNTELKFPELIKIQPQCVWCYEIELVVVLGRAIGDIKHGTRDVLGYTVGNDGCLRGQRPSFVGMDLMGSKCGHLSSAIGPWLTTKDECGGDVTPDIELVTRTNGVVTQRFRSSEMVLGIDEILEQLSYRMHLSGGDVVFTGTGGYVNVPDGFYYPSDVIEMEIEGIGISRNTVEEKDPYPIHESQRWPGSIPGIPLRTLPEAEHAS